MSDPNTSGAKIQSEPIFMNAPIRDIRTNTE